MELIVKILVSERTPQTRLLTISKKHPEDISDITQHSAQQQGLTAPYSKTVLTTLVLPWLMLIWMWMWVMTVMTPIMEAMTEVMQT